jgi:enoyl-CoA hydratase
MPNVIVETRDGVGLLTLNRPEALNALNDALMRELGDALAAFDRDDAIGAVVITGSEKAFAAGADIKEMQAKTFPGTYTGGFLEHWDRVGLCRKPVIAAVAGFALGGGCELAMTCDIIIAADTARFGQPEINLGIIPGAGGTQRLARAIGKAKTMDLVLTGRMIDAAEADRIGLVSRVVPPERLLDEALAVARKIAALSRQAVLMAKEAVNAADQTALSEGLRLERRLFQSLFAGEDQKEGMQAFIEKRKPVFRHR